MHELPATQGILDVALDAARDAGAVRVTSIDVVIGDLTSFVDDSVQFYFDVLSRGTAAEGAVLHMLRRSGIARCSSCMESYAVSPPFVPVCACCGAFTVEITGGREFYIDSIEVDE
jgi:hydrogenase nickel incorporation protein HypA/HybF